MIAGEPKLLQPIRLVRSSFPEHAHAAPGDTVEFSPMLIYSESVPSKTDIWVKCQIVELHSGLGEMQCLPPLVSFQAEGDLDVRGDIGNGPDDRCSERDPTEPNPERE